MKFTAKSALYAAYMPFVKNGGIFIPTTKTYELGAEVFVVLTFALDNDDKPALAGEVAWVNDGTSDKPIGMTFDKKAHNKASGSAEKIPVAGKIIWITPANAKDNRVQGIGVQISELDGGRVKEKIGEWLGAALGSERRTHTM